MNEHPVESVGRQVAGSVKQANGDMLLAAEGAAARMAGTARNAMGDLKDAVRGTGRT